MNRTDRLYALVEDLRAVAPRRRSARELAARYEVSVRTIERDIAALQQSGVPILADVGRTGGYALDKRMSLPPLNFTPAEVVAVGVALQRMRGTPFDAAGRTALARILAALSDESAGAARELAAQVRVVEPEGEPPSAPFAGLVQLALQRRRLIEMSYVDRFGAVSARAVEPSSLMCGGEGWYLIGWCRLREESRVFRLDRIRAAELTDFLTVTRPAYERCDVPPDRVVRTLTLEKTPT
ncbi:helix-turn-helix transcriptional regulator [Nocardia blacklockiae]|uniref:helix-turn-helix transcriptional regulator n=1 Tax=Nocardia blacklockiae TaxID=480036 RepID=UPI001893229B|nr:YafY family protein [Nocardia blacklockiae]MBF6170902.1 YafY family transcriptional regulator [Nocardia blacklockiae]